MNKDKINQVKLVEVEETKNTTNMRSQVSKVKTEVKILGENEV